MKTYIGTVNAGELDWAVMVKVDNVALYKLNPRNDWRNHSPDGFAWGYAGSGPAQLALAILGDLYPREIAERYYQQFKFDVIVFLDKDKGFQIPEARVREIVELYLVGKEETAH